jgi:FkbM family methyltransferase
MNNLLAVKKINSFETILSKLKAHGFVFRDMVDGGAGWGQTSESMIRFGTESSMCFAFEPFPGNHNFFNGKDSRIQLLKMALGNTNKRTKFFVPSVVNTDSEWGNQGLTGYSSVGSLESSNLSAWKGRLTRRLKSILLKEKYDPLSIEVECRQGDEILQAANAKVDFMKLDLQGGELNALQGMTNLLKSLPFMWIEFAGDKHLLDYIVSKDFHLFDTSYFFMGSPTPQIKELFDISKENVTLSTGKTAYFAFKKCGWLDYHAEFMELKKNNLLVQTDIFCVKTPYLDLLHRSLL